MRPCDRVSSGRLIWCREPFGALHGSCWPEASQHDADKLVTLGRQRSFIELSTFVWRRADAFPTRCGAETCFRRPDVSGEATCSIARLATNHSI